LVLFLKVRAREKRGGLEFRGGVVFDTLGNRSLIGRIPSSLTHSSGATGGRESDCTKAG